MAAQLMLLLLLRKLLGRLRVNLHKKSHCFQKNGVAIFCHCVLVDHTKTVFYTEGFTSIEGCGGGGGGKK
jgi:hypothetical protein